MAHKNRPLKWEMRIALMRHSIGMRFPEHFSESHWSSWVDRIKSGHEVEVEHIKSFYNRQMTAMAGSVNDGFDPAEVAGEEFGKTCEVTGIMYAALIVAIWSEIEHAMKRFVPILWQACDPTRYAKEQRIPYQWDKIQNEFANNCSIKLSGVPGFKVMDTIRLLNNHFKHDGGRFQNGPNQKHAKYFLSRWHAMDKKGEIDYSRIPVEKLIAACGQFFRVLILKLQKKLEVISKRQTLATP